MSQRAVTQAGIEPAPAHFAQLSGSWVSDLGSRLELRIARDGRVNGTYSSAVGSTREPQPIAGYASPMAGIVGFVVRWEVTGSLAVWAARYDADRLEATWLLETAGPAATSWRALHTGHDVFRRQEPAAV